MIYEFGWSDKDYDLLSAGTVAGHILECGANQVEEIFLEIGNRFQIWQK
jgi:hypothetical protein